MAKSGKQTAGSGQRGHSAGKAPARRGTTGTRAGAAKGRGGSASGRAKGRSSGRAGRYLRGCGWRMAVVVLVLAVGYVAWLDIRVRAQFEGKRWALPARVYARPIELWTGAPMDPDALEVELGRAGYHPDERPHRPGSYRRAGSRFVILTREFRFWDAVEPSRRIEIGIDAGVVDRIEARDGAVPLVRLDPPVVGRIFPRHHEDRVMVRLDEAPPVLVAGLVAVEDHRFFDHHGISLLAVARAAWANIRAGRVVQGGSTLTQQLAKNLFLSPERTLARKLDEAVMALVLDARYAKEELLEVYLNEVFLGQEGRRAIHGFGLASWFYFDRRLDELDVSEAALLIGLARGASAYNPWRQPERARRRRDLVLEVMAARGVIGREEAAAAKARPLGVRSEVPRGASPHPAFLDLVRRQLSRDYRDGDLRTEGLRIFTTLDPEVQGLAERTLARELTAAERRKGLADGSLEGAVLVARADTGEVQAVVGGRRARAQGFNRALDAKRPIGSLVKPAVYLAALERGYTVASPVDDAPVEVRLSQGRTWAPRNYDGDHLGVIPLYRALALSRNAATARLGLSVGVERVAEVLRRLGVGRTIRPSPSLLLGSLDLSPFEVAQIYQPLANEGFRAPLRGIREVTDPEGRPLGRYGLSVESVAEPAAVFELRSALEAVLGEGTGRSVGRALSPELHPAGKTGTTNGGRDSWFAGFAGGYVAVVWVGFDDNREAGLSGAGQALRVWAGIVSRLSPSGVPPARPDGVHWEWTGFDGAPFRTDPHCSGAVRLPYRNTDALRYRPC